MKQRHENSLDQSVAEYHLDVSLEQQHLRVPSFLPEKSLEIQVRL